MASLQPHVIENDVWQVGILPPTGMSTAFGRVKLKGTWVDFMRPTPPESYGHASDCANFMLIPWSNRIKGALFRFRGKDYQLAVNAADGTAIHGTTRNAPWEIERADPRGITGSFDSRKNPGANFPFAFSTRAELRLDGPSFVNTVWLKNEGNEPMPAGFGHHPYFQRKLTGDGDSAMLEVPCTEYFELDMCIPKGPPLPVDSRLDFRKMRSISGVHVDDCLTGRIPGAPIRFSYPESKLNVTMECDPLFEHIILYMPPGKTFYAVEPLTNANDGFNLFDKGVRGSGVFVLEPGEEKSATFVLRVV
jgi:aldose 1-epimerase